MELVVASRNEGKIREILHLLEGMGIAVTSLADHPDIPEIVEDGETFLENARTKARAVAMATGSWALADDSGLAVDVLGGRPGVHSARYAGRQGDHAANNAKLLEELRDVSDAERSAAFVCTMVLMAPDGREWSVTGRCAGRIGHALTGTEGFGFDPLFVVEGEEGRTMAELPLARKNAISHRGKALREVIAVIRMIAKEWEG